MLKQFSLICVCLFVLDVNGYYGRKQFSACDVADPIPLRRITLNMIEGTWRCHQLKSAKRFPAKDLATTFNIIIHTPLANGSAAVEATGRLISTCDCFSSLVFWNITSGKNSYRETSEFASSVRGGRVEWRFLDLIGQYLLAQQCIEFDENERCLRSFINIFSRRNDDIPLHVLKWLNQSVRKTLCLDIFEDFLEWPRDIDCPSISNTKSVRRI